MFHRLSFHREVKGKIGIIILATVVLTGFAFIIFPEALRASSVVTVFAGIFGILLMILKESGK